MKWRKYPEEKPRKNGWDGEIFIHCCCNNQEDESFYLGNLVYKPDYDAFFRRTAGRWMDHVSFIDEMVHEDVTHFAFNDDIDLPEPEKPDYAD